MATTTMRKNNMPAFVETSYANLAKAIVDKKFTTAIYAYLTDKQMFCYVTAAGSIHIMRGLNWQIQNVTELPSVDEGDKEVLYIMDDVVYTFNGTDYVRTYYKLEQKVEILEADIATLQGRTTTLETDTATMKSDIEEVQNNLSMIIGV